MAGMPEAIRQASAASRSQGVIPSGRGPVAGSRTTSLGPSRSTPVHPFDSKGRSSTPALLPAWPRRPAAALSTFFARRATQRHSRRSISTLERRRNFLSRATMVSPNPASVSRMKPCASARVTRSRAVSFPSGCRSSESVVAPMASAAMSWLNCPCRYAVASSPRTEKTSRGSR